MFCTGCGAQSSVEGQKFCDSCGAALQSTASQSVPPAPSSPPGPTGQFPPQPTYSAPPQPTYSAPPQPTYSAPPQPTYAAPPQPGYSSGPTNYGDPGRISALNFFQAIKYCFTRYFVGKDRAVRSEYWYFYLGFVIFARIVNAMFPSPFDADLVLLIELVWLIPLTVAGVRRMHDVGKSGWFLLIPIYNLVLLCTEGDAGPNQYGNPVDYRGLV